MKTICLKTCGCIAVVLLAGCATQEVHWNAVKMREHVNDYYENEIMDNLIRGKEGLLFVHVDITSLSSGAASKLNGTIGGGETHTNATTASATGVISSIVRTVMRPFTYSITPERSNNLIISSSP